MPLFPLNVITEILINGTWRNVSTYVMERDTMTITGGQAGRGDVAQPAGRLGRPGAPAGGAVERHSQDDDIVRVLEVGKRQAAPGVTGDHRPDSTSRIR